MTREELTRKICPSFMYSNCENQEDCNYCKGKMNIWLDEHDKQIRTEVIDEVMKLPMHFFAIDGELYIKARDIEQLKEQKYGQN